MGKKKGHKRKNKNNKNKNKRKLERMGQNSAKDVSYRDVPAGWGGDEFKCEERRGDRVFPPKQVRKPTEQPVDIPAAKQTDQIVDIPKTPPWSKAFVSDKCQYTVGSSGSCTILSLETSLLMLSQTAPSVALLEEILKVGSLYSSRLHTNIQDVLPHVKRYGEKVILACCSVD